jgi:hypothetical protein
MDAQEGEARQGKAVVPDGPTAFAQLGIKLITDRDGRENAATPPVGVVDE